MTDEILDKALSTDTEVVPRYTIKSADGAVLHENVSLELENEVLQEGTALNKANLLSDDTAALYFDEPTGAETVDEVLNQVLDKFDVFFKVGDILSTVRTNLGDKWLLCDGSTVLAENYPDLGEVLTVSSSGYITLPNANYLRYYQAGMYSTVSDMMSQQGVYYYIRVSY